jgi:hypothetical protein
MYQLPSLSFTDSLDLNLNINLRLGMRYLFGSWEAGFRILGANSFSAGIPNGREMLRYFDCFCTMQRRNDLNVMLLQSCVPPYAQP